MEIELSTLTLTLLCCSLGQGKITQKLKFNLLQALKLKTQVTSGILIPHWLSDTRHHLQLLTPPKFQKKRREVSSLSSLCRLCSSPGYVQAGHECPSEAPMAQYFSLSLLEASPNLPAECIIQTDPQGSFLACRMERQLTSQVTRSLHVVNRRITSMSSHLSSTRLIFPPQSRNQHRFS